MAVISHVPQVTFKTRVRDESVPGPNPYRWQDLTSDEIFKGRKVVLVRRRLDRRDRATT